MRDAPSGEVSSSLSVNYGPGGKVLHLACVPTGGLQGPGGGPPGQQVAAGGNYTLWVALKNKMEYYHRGKSGTKEERPLAKQVGTKAVGNVNGKGCPYWGSGDMSGILGAMIMLWGKAAACCCAAS